MTYSLADGQAAGGAAERNAAQPAALHRRGRGAGGEWQHRDDRRVRRGRLPAPDSRLLSDRPGLAKASAAVLLHTRPLFNTLAGVPICGCRDGDGGSCI